jgi:hypothetical protein
LKILGKEHLVGKDTSRCDLRSATGGSRR